MVSALSELKLTTQSKPTHRNAVVVRRQKLIERVFEQLRLIESYKSGTSSQAYRTVRKTNPDTGLVELTQTDRKISPWWWSTADGKWYLSIKYGTQVLELAKGKGSIQVDGLLGVESTLRVIGEAAEKGDLDDVLTATGQNLRKRFQH